MSVMALCNNIVKNVYDYFSPGGLNQRKGVFL